MNYIWEIIINILESSLFFVLMNGKLTRKNIKKPYLKQAFAAVILSGIVFICNNHHVLPPVILLSVLILYYIFACLFFSSSHTVTLFWVIVFIIITIFSDALLTIIPTNVLHIDIASLLAGGNLRIPITLLYVSTIAAIVIILLCLPSKSFKLSLFQRLGVIILSMLCISIEDIIVIGQAKMYLNNTYSSMWILYLVFFLVLTLFVALMIYVYILGLEKEKNIQLSNQYILSEMERKQYDQIISSISELRYMKHDINNHLQTLSSLISNNKYSEATDYINDLSMSVNKNYHILSSGNSTIDSIVTNKLIQCKAAKITVHYSIYLTDTIPLSNIELCSLLGNLFDNAIEASQNIPVPDIRVIDFSIKPYQDMLSIVVTNNTNGVYVSDKNNNLLSSKNDPTSSSHGLGLSRINSIIKKHNGIIDVTPDSDKFTVSILIPLYQEMEI